MRLGLGHRRVALPDVVRPQPDGDPRDWIVLAGAERWTNPGPYSSLLAAARDAGRRVLFVDPPPRLVRWRCTIDPVEDSVWRATVPTLLPFGRWLPPVDAVNHRVAGALLRRWLDRRPGARLLRVDPRGVPLAGRLGEDLVVPVVPGAPVQPTATPEPPERRPPCMS